MPYDNVTHDFGGIFLKTRLVFSSSLKTLDLFFKHVTCILLHLVEALRISVLRLKNHQTLNRYRHDMSRFDPSLPKHHTMNNTYCAHDTYLHITVSTIIKPLIILATIYDSLKCQTVMLDSYLMLFNYDLTVFDSYLTVFECFLIVFEC
jgi:hypothetical protein